MLNEKIKHLRKEKGLSLEQLAEIIGTSRQTVHRYETGVITNIPSEKVEAMAKALGTTPQSLMGWEDESDFSTLNSISAIGLAAVGTKSLPILGNVACGEPIFASEEKSHFVRAKASLGADFCLTARGDSMINARIFEEGFL